MRRGSRRCTMRHASATSERQRSSSSTAPTPTPCQRHSTRRCTLPAASPAPRSSGSSSAAVAAATPGRRTPSAHRCTSLCSRAATTCYDACWRSPGPTLTSTPPTATATRPSIEPRSQANPVWLPCSSATTPPCRTAAVGTGRHSIGRPTADMWRSSWRSSLPAPTRALRTRTGAPPLTSQPPTTCGASSSRRARGRSQAPPPPHSGARPRSRARPLRQRRRRSAAPRRLLQPIRAPGARRSGGSLRPVEEVAQRPPLATRGGRDPMSPARSADRVLRHRLCLAAPPVPAPRRPPQPAPLNGRRHNRSGRPGPAAIPRDAGGRAGDPCRG
mmetsp:Transcript_260/g.521  ORF Transcript_260/g.521 Transcript_260/m.521 type:complete len:330 (-) Transcript_260:961-1950(-)